MSETKGTLDPEVREILRVIDVDSLRNTIKYQITICPLSYVDKVFKAFIQTECDSFCGVLFDTALLNTGCPCDLLPVSAVKEIFWEAYEEAMEDSNEKNYK